MSEKKTEEATEKIVEKKKNIFEKKWKIPIIVGVAIVAVILIFEFGISKSNLLSKDDILTSAQLEKAVDISELSTAEFIYNGIAEKYKDEEKEKVECYITYDANVKVGIQMEDIQFKIDDKAKTITPILPQITVNVATLDEDSLSYIPKNPDIEMKEIITICKEDAMNEANSSKELYQTAEENLKSIIEALLSPILKDSGYNLQWA